MQGDRMGCVNVLVNSSRTCAHHFPPCVQRICGTKQLPRNPALLRWTLQVHQFCNIRIAFNFSWDSCMLSALTGMNVVGFFVERWMHMCVPTMVSVVGCEANTKRAIRLPTVAPFHAHGSLTAATPHRCQEESCQTTLELNCSLITQTLCCQPRFLSLCLGADRCVSITRCYHLILTLHVGIGSFPGWPVT